MFIIECNGAKEEFEYAENDPIFYLHDAVDEPAAN